MQKGSVSITCYSTPEILENGNINMHPFAVHNLKVHCMCDYNALLHESFTCKYLYWEVKRKYHHKLRENGKQQQDYE